MVDRIKKFLRKLPHKRYLALIPFIKKIKEGDINDLDVKQLKQFRHVFRVRKGKIRIIFQRKYGKNIILSIEYRNERTYK